MNNLENIFIFILFLCSTFLFGFNSIQDALNEIKVKENQAKQVELKSIQVKSDEIIERIKYKSAEIAEQCIDNITLNKIENSGIDTLSLVASRLIEKYRLLDDKSTSNISMNNTFINAITAACNDDDDNN
ncbi:hypothetical protein HY745_09530, partial [Candidatus Desantisbacteria bacterium]|nr:hypothetical protein [Candidatus Desantisbacteria bacterium]